MLNLINLSDFLITSCKLLCMSLYDHAQVHNNAILIQYK